MAKQGGAVTPETFVPPMLAVTAPSPFSESGWWFETKWDGYRAQVNTVGSLAIRSRHGHDLLHDFPSLRAIQAELPAGVVLDAELVAWHEGQPQFRLLQQRRGSRYLLMVFDCLYADGCWLLQEPLFSRQVVLRHLVQSGQYVAVVDGVETHGEEYFQACQAAGLEGVMAKRLDSLYLPGQRSRLWQKFLSLRVDWFWVIAAQTSPSGAWYWIIAEKTDAGIRRVGKLQAPPTWRPQTGAQPPFRIEVSYRERTREGHLRHARIRQWLS